MAPPLGTRLGALVVFLVVVASPIAVLGGAAAAAAPAGVAPGAVAPVAAGPISPSTNYLVTFIETGLPADFTWQIQVDHTTDSELTDGGTDELYFNLAPGTHTYTITNIQGWQQSNLSYSGSLVVSSSPLTEPVLTYSPITYAVTFTETGLPADLTWEVTVGGSPQSLLTDGGTDSLVFLEPNGTYSYAISDISGWHESTLPYSGHVEVVGAPVTEPTAVYFEVTYSVEFFESGLPAGLSWAVTVNGDLQSVTTVAGLNSLTWSGLPNGTYGYAITDVSGWTQSTLAASGDVVVNGASVSEPELVYSKVTYTVTFTEIGLPADLTWQVSLGRVSQAITTDGGEDVIGFTEGNGTFAYAISVVSGWEQFTLPSTGNVGVAGASVDVTTVVYVQVNYSVSFTESGLPEGTNWSVTLGDSPQNTTGPTITYSEPNGTYSYSIGIVPGWEPTVPSGSKTVSGAPIAVPVTFVRVLYAIDFTETGLPADTSWSVTIGSTNSSTSSTVAFLEPNGTYTYAFGEVSGYEPASHSGGITINGGPAAIPVVFTHVLYTVTYREIGLPTHGAATRWSVSFDGSLETTMGPTLTFPAGNGSHAYVIAGPAGWEVAAILPPAGTTAVAGASVQQNITFLRGPTYSIAFHELGLAAGTRWCVTLGSTLCSATPTVKFVNLTPGAYSYSIAGFGGMITVVHLGAVLVAPSGSASVAPSRLYQVRFTYPVTFTESGLPGSTSWKVSAGGQSVTSTSTTHVLDLINGTYAFTVAHIKFYITTPATGRIPVAGGPVAVAIHFSPAPGHRIASTVATPPVLEAVGRTTVELRVP